MMENQETPVRPVSHELSWRMADGQSSVDIRMAERAGEIRITVHTPSHDLADSLRSDLPELVGKLRQNGFQAETWRPEAVAQSEGSRQKSPDDGSSQQHAPGDRRDGRQPPSQQQKDQSRWAGEWHSSLEPAQESNT